MTTDCPEMTTSMNKLFLHSLFLACPQLITPDLTLASLFVRTGNHFHAEVCCAFPKKLYATYPVLRLEEV